MRPSWVAILVLPSAALVVAIRASANSAAHAGPWRRVLERLTRDRASLAAAWFVLALCAIAALAPRLALYAPDYQDADALNAHPLSPTHALGTDLLGRDLLSRLMHGGRVSLAVAMLSVLLSTTVGVVYGATAGFYGGRVDSIMMRTLDAAISVPRVLLLLAVFALWGHQSITALVLLMGLTGWFGISRQVRAQVSAARPREYAVAARALGAPDARVLWRHILPNALSPAIVAASLGIGNVIILEAGLSYLGFGVQPPRPSWGNIIQDSGGVLSPFWWMAIFPGALIVATVLAFNMIGDGLRDAMDPRQLPRS
ncbi:MAG: ABC transporter permease [Gemmatimonadaceae bacterium]